MHIQHILDKSGFEFMWHYHHALVDGWSASVITRDFELAYLHRLQPVAIPFSLVRQRKHEKAQSQALRDFWKADLEAATPTRLREYTMQPHPEREWRHDQGLDCRNLDITGIEEVVGPCINTVPFRMKIEGCKSRDNYIQDVHSKCAALVEHDALLLREIYRAAGQTDLLDSSLIYQNYTKFSNDPDLPFTMEVVDTKETADIPFNVMISRTRDSRFHFAALPHRKTLYGRWLCGRSRINNIVNLCDLSLIRPGEQTQVERLSIDPIIPKLDQSAWHLFCKQAHANKHQIAISFHTSHYAVQRFDYGTVHVKAEMIAQCLSSRGMG
ncbi:hypothetical protein GQ44DRAFT_756811 [Phaeosphaeriaceae sp. PMI808]|nr:hypothetical protein GQ44DRAFT_756811 [Phaeosphaeriaceae sp. PMI808]